MSYPEFYKSAVQCTIAKSPVLHKTGAKSGEKRRMISFMAMTSYFQS